MNSLKPKINSITNLEIKKQPPMFSSNVVAKIYWWSVDVNDVEATLVLPPNILKAYYKVEKRARHLVSVLIFLVTAQLPRK